MGTWNALYVRGELPPSFRPHVDGRCAVRRVVQWTELTLPGVVDGDESARALSKLVAGEVIWGIVQTTASAVGIAHYVNGQCTRRLEFADGSWDRVEGAPQPWEAWLFSEEELDAAKEVTDVEEYAELETAFASKRLESGGTLPWPREWAMLHHALGLTEAEWQEAQALPPLAVVEGDRGSKLTVIARGSLLLGIGVFAGSLLTRDGGWGALAVLSFLVAFGAGYLRRAVVGRWFL